MSGADQSKIQEAVRRQRTYRGWRRAEGRRFLKFDQVALSARILARSRMTRRERINADVAAGKRPPWPVYNMHGSWVGGKERA